MLGALASRVSAGPVQSTPRLDGIDRLITQTQAEVVELNSLHELLRKSFVRLEEQHTALREDHAILCDCLHSAGHVAGYELRARRSARQGMRLLCDVLLAPELALLVGRATGVASARHAAASSKKHGEGMRAALPILCSSLLPDVYVVGGEADDIPLAAAERFDPTIGHWEPVPPMTTARHACAAATSGGCLYVFGGSSGRAALATAERFVPTAGRWEAVRPMPTARFRCAAASVAGMLYVFGGYGGGQTLATSERYDVASGRWEAVAPMPTARYGCAAAAVGGMIYVFGGLRSGQALATVERFDPARVVMTPRSLAGPWTSLPKMSAPRYGCAAVAVQRFLYVFGGYDGNQVLATAERINLVSSRWELLPPMPSTRDCCAAAVSAGNVYVFGGSGGRQALASSDRFDPISGKWDALPAMSRARKYCIGAALPR